MNRAIRTCRGFTLTEMVLVIVLLGIVGGVLAPFLMESMRAYQQTRQRADLVSRGRLALERLAREVRQAVPNSLVTLSGGQGIEFLRGRSGGRYVDRFDSFGSAFSAITRRFQKNAMRSELYKVGTDLTFQSGDRLVIGNTSPAELLAGTTMATLTGVIATTVAADGTDQGQVMQYAAHRFVNASPGKHVAIADATVEVGLAGAALHWYEGAVSSYDNGVDWSSADPVLVDGVSSLLFTYAPGNPSATGVLRVELQLVDGGESVDLYHEVHVRNTP